MKIKPILQEFSKNCASACLRMVLSYYNHPAVRDVVEGGLWHDEEGYTLETELALYARRQGFAVDCHAYNLYLTDPATTPLCSREELIEKLKEEQEHPWLKEWYKPKLASTLRCLQAGVNYLIRKPSLPLIGSYLAMDVPLIVTVNPSALYGKQGDPLMTHDIVLSGSEGAAQESVPHTIHIIDPATGTESSLKSEDLYFAMTARSITAASAYMVSIKPAISHVLHSNPPFLPPSR